MAEILDQFYYTHCTAVTSKVREAEYSVRAASLPAEQITNRLVQMLSTLADYHLPLDMYDVAQRNVSLGPGEAPVRLARLRLADGRAAIVHAVYRPTDTGGRPMSFFAHILLPRGNSPSLTTEHVLRLWGAEGGWGGTEGWVWQDDARRTDEAAKDLPPWMNAGGANRSILSPDALRKFLVGDPLPASSRRPSLQIAPERLQGEQNRQRRRFLLELVLSAYLSRRQVYLVAEPGLAALAVYAVTQALPPELGRDICFSTFEPYHRTFARSNADVVNTFWDPATSQELKFSDFRDSQVALNTFTWAQSPNFAPPERVCKYARYVVDLLENGDFEAFPAIWKQCTEALRGAPVDAASLLETWWTCRLVANLDSSPLADADLKRCLGHPYWRPAILRHPRGRSQALKAATSLPANLPEWWPTGPNDAERLRDFQPCLADVRGWLVDHIARELSIADNVEEHKQRAAFSLNRLMPPLTDRGFPATLALQQIIEALETLAAGAPLEQRLPWSTRAWVLSNLATPQFVNNGFAERRAKWLRTANNDELLRLCDLRLPEKWKAESLCASLHASSVDSDRLTRLFTERPALFRAMLDQMAQQHKPLRALLEALFRAATTIDDRMQFFLLLLDLDGVTGFVEQGECYALLFRELLETRAQSPVSWNLLFAEGNRYLQHLDNTVGKFAPRLLSSFWERCCTSLQVACLFEGDANRVLRTLLANEANIRLRPEVQVLLSHWKRLYASLGRTPTPGAPDWYALRWSLKTLDLRPAGQQILAALVQTSVGAEGVTPEVLYELGECTRAMLPNPSDALSVARSLVGASQGLPMETRDMLHTQVAMELCRDNLPRCRQFLTQLRGALSAGAILALETMQSELAGRSKADRAATKSLYLTWAPWITTSFLSALVLVMAVAIFRAHSQGAAYKQEKDDLSAAYKREKDNLNAQCRKQQAEISALTEERNDAKTKLASATEQLKTEEGGKAGLHTGIRDFAQHMRDFGEPPENPIGDLKELGSAIVAQRTKYQTEIEGLCDQIRKLRVSGSSPTVPEAQPARETNAPNKTTTPAATNPTAGRPKQQPQPRRNTEGKNEEPAAPTAPPR